MSNLGTGGPLSVYPVASNHRDVHRLVVSRTNGESVTVEEFVRVFEAVTGRRLDPDEVANVAPLFAEEDR